MEPNKDSKNNLQSVADSQVMNSTDGNNGLVDLEASFDEEKKIEAPIIQPNNPSNQPNANLNSPEDLSGMPAKDELPPLEKSSTMPSKDNLPKEGKGIFFNSSP